jgi:hypothetical protein
MEGWSKQEKNNHKVFMPGLEGGFERYNMTAKMLAVSALDHFIKEREAGIERDDMLQSYQKPNHMLRLPVCISKVQTIEDIKPASFSEQLHWKIGFPFQCGDHHSNGTNAFLKNTNIDPTNEPTLWSVTLANNLKRYTLPANRYALLCTLGVRWPTWSRSAGRFDTKDKLVPNARDLQCSNFTLQTAAMDEFDMNVHFCTDAAMVRQMKREHPWLINTTPNAKSHKRMCRRFLRKNRARAIVAMGGTKQKVKEYEALLEELKSVVEDAKNNATTAAVEADEADDAEWAAEDSVVEGAIYDD